MEGGDPDAPTHKRPRLDSVNPVNPIVYNALPLPPHPPQTQSARPPTAQASSPPPTTRHYPPQSLPPPSQGPGPAPGPAPAHYQGPSPSPSLPPNDIRAYSDPRNIPSPGQRPHGGPVPPVTLPARTITQDSISTYARPQVTPQSSVSDAQHSRSASADSKPPGMEHGGHTPSWPVNPDQRHNGTMSNGYTVVSPTHEQSYQPSPIPPAQQHYSQPVQSYPPGSYIGPATQYAHGGQIRRKQVRATQACNHCRSRKQKCDEARPCQFCRENNFDCQYKDVPPPKQDRSMMQLQDSVNNISDVLKTFVEGFNTWKDSVESRLPPLPRGGDGMLIGPNHPSPENGYSVRSSFGERADSRMATPHQQQQPRTHLRRVGSMQTSSPHVTGAAISPAAGHVSTPIKQEALSAAPQPPATPAESVRTEHTTTAAEHEDKNMGLMADHSTPAHLLLDRWTLMAPFTNNVPTLRKLREAGHEVTDYPMELEQKRGLLRVWGKGEGHDMNDGAQNAPSPESSEMDAPSPVTVKDNLWGPLDSYPSPSTIHSDTTHEEGSVGGMRDGVLQLDYNVCMKLLNSYHDNIHTLHPFLNPSKLRRMVKEFLDLYSTEKRGTSAMSPGSALPNHMHAGVKRKRSASTFGDPFSPGRERPASDMIEKSLRNAIVLLVFALGKVCEYKKPLPAPQADRNPLVGSSWGYGRGSPHSSSASFSDDSSDGRQRNIDLLPGMAYYSYATDILGNQQGGNTVAHAQAMLLAALYLGQFARVLESWSWINNACRVCLILIKADMDKISRNVLFENNTKPRPPIPQKELFRLNLVKCVYWTCLQLETDILAEMSNLPPSDISKYQETISYPSGVFEKFPDPTDEDSPEHEKTMWTYSSMIHLRVILNEAHNTLYGNHSGKKRPPSLDVSNLNEVSNAARVHADILWSWRRLLPAQLAWSDDEPPSTDINVARLRAKFYGGYYMVLRPFLFIATHEIELPPGPPISSAWSSKHGSPAAYTDAATPTNRHRSLVELTSEQNGILHVAFRCINSAIQSTIAFDRVGKKPSDPYRYYEDRPDERPVLTNIFGTLHAQFGNMLVLAAVWKSHLRAHLPAECNLTHQNLAKLFRRTIDTLNDVAPNSPVLRVDVEILENVRRVVGIDC